MKFLSPSSLLGNTEKLVQELKQSTFDRCKPCFFKLI